MKGTRQESNTRWPVGCKLPEEYPRILGEEIKNLSTLWYDSYHLACRICIDNAMQMCRIDMGTIATILEDYIFHIFPAGKDKGKKYHRIMHPELISDDEEERLEQTQDLKGVPYTNPDSSNPARFLLREKISLSEQESDSEENENLKSFEVMEMETFVKFYEIKANDRTEAKQKATSRPYVAERSEIVSRIFEVEEI